MVNGDHINMIRLLCGFVGFGLALSAPLLAASPKQNSGFALRLATGSNAEVCQALLKKLASIPAKVFRSGQLVDVLSSTKWQINTYSWAMPDGQVIPVTYKHTTFDYDNDGKAEEIVENVTTDTRGIHVHWRIYDASDFREAVATSFTPRVDYSRPFLNGEFTETYMVPWSYGGVNYVVFQDVRFSEAERHDRSVVLKKYVGIPTRRASELRPEMQTVCEIRK
jgi:hypothetical protein